MVERPVNERSSKPMSLDEWYLRTELGGVSRMELVGEIERLTALLKDTQRQTSIDYDELTRERDRLRAALEWIASRESEARDAVAKGFHNTTFAIDLAGHAAAALRGAHETDAGFKEHQEGANVPFKAHRGADETATDGYSHTAGGKTDGHSPPSVAPNRSVATISETNSNETPACRLQGCTRTEPHDHGPLTAESDAGWSSTCKHGTQIDERHGCRKCAAEETTPGQIGHTCHNGATIYLNPGKKCRWCDAVNETSSPLAAFVRSPAEVKEPIYKAALERATAEQLALQRGAHEHPMRRAADGHIHLWGPEGSCRTCGTTR